MVESLPSLQKSFRDMKTLIAAENRDQKYQTDELLTQEVSRDFGILTESNFEAKGGAMVVVGIEQILTILDEILIVYRSEKSRQLID
jgi:hypothetical protein